MFVSITATTHFSLLQKEQQPRTFICFIALLLYSRNLQVVLNFFEMEALEGELETFLRQIFRRHFMSCTHLNVMTHECDCLNV
jgi:hypothetical protein